jgi:hypothetical protein
MEVGAREYGTWRKLRIKHVIVKLICGSSMIEISKKKSSSEDYDHSRVAW